MSTTDAAETGIAGGAHSHSNEHGAHGGHGAAPAPAHRAEAHGQQHPLKLYLVVWVLLFVLSTCSYLVDYFNFQGLMRWFLIVLFMFLKAGAIVAVFMHMAWERLALAYAILLPPLALTVFMAMMAFEGDYTIGSRVAHFDPPLPIAAPAEQAGEAAKPAAGAGAEHAREAAPQPAATAAAPAPARQIEVNAPDPAPRAWAPEWLRSPPPVAEEREEKKVRAWAPEWLR